MFGNLAKIVAAAVFVGCATSGGTLRAGEFDDVARISLLPGWVMDNGNRMAGLRVQLAPGWKTYWRRPGDAGIPPRFDWTGSGNVAKVGIHWPVPIAFDQNGLRSLGYENEVVFPLEFTPVSTGSALEITGRIEIGVCQEVCIPMQATISGRFSGAGARDPLINTALTRLAEDARARGFPGAECAITPIGDGLRVAVRLTLPNGFANPGAVAIETADPTIWVSDPEIDIADNVMTASSEMVPVDAQPFLLERSGIRVTLVKAGRAVDYRGCTAFR